MNIDKAHLESLRHSIFHTTIKGNSTDAYKQLKDFGETAYKVSDFDSTIKTYLSDLYAISSMRTIKLKESELTQFRNNMFHILGELIS